MPNQEGLNTVDDYLAGNVPIGGRLLCPFHPDRDPTMRVLPGAGRAYCYRCGIAEDRLGMAMRLLFPDSYRTHRGTEIEIAIQWLERRGATPRMAYVEEPAKPIDLDVYRTITAFCDLANRRLAHDGQAVAELRATRGLADPVALGFGIGHWGLLDALDEVLATTVDDWAGRRAELLLQAGINGRTKDGPKYRLKNRFVLPEWRKLHEETPSGFAEPRIVPFYQARCRDGRSRSKYLSPEVPKHFWGWDTLDRSTGVVFVGEGVFDVAPLVEAGESALAVLGLHLGPLGEHLDNLVATIGNRLVVICFDNDEPDEAAPVGVGHAQALALHAKLEAAGAEVAITHPPAPFHDMGDWLAHTPAARVAGEIKLAL